MNHVIVKQDKQYSTQFCRDYPQQLYGVLEPTEYDQTITRINSLSATPKRSKLFGASIPMLILGFILLAVGFVKEVHGLIVFAALLFVGGIIFTIILSVKYARAVNGAISTALAEANHYYEARRVTFKLEHKQSKKRFHNNDRRHPVSKMRIRIEFPVPNSPYMVQQPIQMAFGAPQQSIYVQPQQQYGAPQQYAPPQPQQQYGAPQQQQYAPPQQQQQPQQYGAPQQQYSTNKQVDGFL